MAKTKRFTFTLDKRLIPLMQSQADMEFRSIASLINAAIAEYLKQRGHSLEELGDLEDLE